MILEVRFLGVPHVALDGRPVQLQRQASMALIAYLILTRRPASRLDLAGLLAGESSEASARKLLRNALADLHHGGVGPYLLATRDTVALDLDLPLRVDTEMIDGLVDGWGGASLEELEWAVGHCDVELLAGIELHSAPGFDAWLANERRRRQHEIMRLALHLLDRYCTSGALESGMSLADRILAVEPWREEVHRLLMWLLALSGQRAAAMEQYVHCRRALAEELGVEPEPLTTALFEELRGQGAPALGSRRARFPSVSA